MFLGQEDPLEEEMATCSSILAWRVPWTEEPGRQQSIGLQRVHINRWWACRRVFILVVSNNSCWGYCSSEARGWLHQQAKGGVGAQAWLESAGGEEIGSEEFSPEGKPVSSSWIGQLLEEKVRDEIPASLATLLPSQLTQPGCRQSALPPCVGRTASALSWVPGEWLWWAGERVLCPPSPSPHSPFPLPLWWASPSSLLQDLGPQGWLMRSWGSLAKNSTASPLWSWKWKLFSMELV